MVDLLDLGDGDVRTATTHLLDDRIPVPCGETEPLDEEPIPDDDCLRRSSDLMEREHTSTDLRGVVDVVMDEGRGVDELACDGRRHDAIEAPTPHRLVT